MVAAGICALLYLPARHWLTARSNRMLYGERVSPEETVRTFGQRLTRSIPIDELMLGFRARRPLPGAQCTVRHRRLSTIEAVNSHTSFPGPVACGLASGERVCHKVVEPCTADRLR